MGGAYISISPHVCDLVRDNSTYTLGRFKREQPYAPDALAQVKDSNCRLKSG